MKTSFCIVGALLILASCNHAETSFPTTSPLFITNEAYIKGLYTQINLDDPIEVFNYVFQNLPQEVTVFPSENVYYFRFPMLGRTYDGTLTLYAHERDSGILGFGYVNRMETRTQQKNYPLRGGSHDFKEVDGLQLEKINSLKYKVSYKNKNVVFNLYVLSDSQPQKLQLTTNEKWVSSTFDESGLQFHLVFNKQAKRMYWVLSEENYVPEAFHFISAHMVAGDRTEFVFYNDTLHHRKILVGVEGENVMQNNWYDGPFDHLPDNRVYEGKLDMRLYLEQHYPAYKGQIDKYGHFLKRGGRVALAPYKVYFSLGDLAFIEDLAIKKMNETEFFSAITGQVYDLPQNYYRR